MRWVGHVVHMGGWRGVYRLLVRKPEGRRPLGRPGHRWEEVGGGSRDWMVMAEDRDRWRALVSAVTNLWFP